MGVAGSPSRHSKTALRTAKDNRRITCTLQPESASANQSAFAPATVQEKRTRLRRRKFLGPETRPGTHQQLPISIDSDDENNSAASSNTQRQPISIESDGETDSVVSPTTQPPPIAIESDDELDSVVALETSASAAIRVYSLKHHSSRALTVKSASRSRHLQSRCTPSAPAATPQRATAQKTLSSPASSYADDGIQLTLAGIKDFNLRQKTAQLMAEAPGLPVADLYHLLMDRGGHFEAAKQDAIRRSQRPSTVFSTLKPPALARAATVPLTAPVDIQEQLEDETYVKIDFDDPDFKFDNDAPVEPPSELGRRRHHNQAQPKKTASKSIAKPVKNIARARDINRGMRATSYDLAFIVPDDEVLEDSDETYSMSDDSGTSDVDMTDDGTDSCIDMEPEYSYNSNILSSLSSG